MSCENLIPMDADFDLEFTDLVANISPVTLDLTTLDDIICVIAGGHPDGTIVARLTQLVNPTRFTIDNVNKIVRVHFVVNGTPDGDFPIGNYYANLWLVVDGDYLTHEESVVFNITASVDHAAP